MRAISSTLALIAAAIFAACAGDPHDGPVPFDEGALVVTSDYQTGAYSAVDRTATASHNSLGVIHQDAVCRWADPLGMVFVVARLGADAIDVVDPAAGWSIVSEYSVGASSNPQDIAVVSEDRAYVARMGLPTLLAVHPLDGTVIDEIDLSALADDDGNPEAAWALAHDDAVFVALQKLSGFEPTGRSSIAVVEASTGEVEGEIELSSANVYGKLRYSGTVDRIVVVEAGVFGVLDGGLEYLDPVTRAVSGFVVTEEALGGDLCDAVIASPTKGYAVIGVPHGTQARTSLVTFDPTTGEKLAELIVQDSWALGFLEITDDGGAVWVTDRTPTSPGIRVFDTADDSEIGGGPLDVGLPPFMACFTR